MKKAKFSSNPYTSHRSKKTIDAAEVLGSNEDLGRFGSPSPSKLTKGGEITIHKGHHKNRTLAGPELTNHSGTLLPQIKGSYGSTSRPTKKKGSELKELNDSQSDAACPDIK